MASKHDTIRQGHRRPAQTSGSSGSFPHHDDNGHGSDTRTIKPHFDGKSEIVRKIYDRLFTEVSRFGKFVEDPKKTSIHWNRRTAFAGIATRKERLILTVKASEDKASPRIRKHERASANRWHLEVALASPQEVDHELLAWLKEAYELSA